MKMANDLTIYHSGLDPESSVFLFANAGKGKDTGFPIIDVGNDRKDRQ